MMLKNHIYKLLALLILFTGCSVEDGVDGIDGVDGYSIGASIVEINDCLEISFFKDYNGDGILNEEDSLIDEFIICNGENGAGGQDGQDGADGADGTDGTNGADGQDGADGISIGLISEDIGDGCTRLTFFRDLNLNEILDNSETIITTFDVCNGQDTTGSTSKVTVDGFAQKGPFINGSSIIISELDNEFSQTGKSFNTQIKNNSGKFEIKNIPLVSNFINTRVDGFYFNEVTGKKSNAQITLNGIVDISENKQVNLNVLTHLEKSRVEYLLDNTQLNFDEAKKQAQREVLSIFEVDQEQVDIESEKMDLSSENIESEILLAISSILQGYRSEADFSSLLAEIISDIEADGKLDLPNNGSKLISHAKLLDPVSISQNTRNRYLEIGDTISVGDFGRVITQFVQETEFVDNEEVIEFPQYDGYANVNILSLADGANFPSGQSFSIVANLPIEEMTIRAEFLLLETNSIYSGGLSYAIGGQGWTLIQNSNFSENLPMIFNTSLKENYMRLFSDISQTAEARFYINQSETPFKTINIKPSASHNSGGGGG